MSRFRLLKMGVCLIALIGISGLIGGLVGRRLAHIEQTQRNNPENWNESAMRTFERVVKPTAEQRQKLQARLDAAVAELKAIRTDTITRSTNVIWRLVEDVEKELTPEQRLAFEQMKPKHDELSTLDVLQVEPRKK